MSVLYDFMFYMSLLIWFAKFVKILTRCGKQSQQSVSLLSKTISELLRLKVCPFCLYYFTSMDDLVDDTSQAINCIIAASLSKIWCPILQLSNIFVLEKKTIQHFVYRLSMLCWSNHMMSHCIQILSTMHCLSVMYIHNIPDSTSIARILH